MFFCSDNPGTPERAFLALSAFLGGMCKVPEFSNSRLRNRDVLHHHRRNGVIGVVALGLTDLHHDVHARHDFAENRVLGRGQVVPPVIQEVVVHGVDEELAYDK
jgi:hypothetical protein